MLALPKKTEYALIALHHLMANPAETACAREIAELYSLPGALLQNVMKDLQQAALVTSTRGAKGGYQLAADPAHTSLYDVLQATSGEIALTECCGGAGQHTCNTARRTVAVPDIGTVGGVELKIAGCPIREPLKHLHTRLVTLLKNVKLSDLLAQKPKPLTPELVSL